MRRQTLLTLTIAALAPIVLSACGGDRPAGQAPPPASAAPAASATAPAAAQAEPAAKPANDQVAQAAPTVAQSVETPAAKPPPAPPPPPAPKPEPIVKTVPVGTELIVELVDGASSQTSQVGNAVRARVTRAVVGAAAGTGIAAGTKGQAVELPVGTTLALQIEQPMTITVEP